MLKKYNKIIQETHFIRLIVLFFFATMISACGGGSDGIKDPIDEADNLFPDCTTGSANYSGCWISETCDFDSAIPDLSSHTIFRYKEKTFDPVSTGETEVFGVVYDNETCSGSPVLVSNVGFLESYTQKDDATCVDTGGTDLAPWCTNLELQLIHEDGTAVSGIDPVDFYIYVINDTRLCQPSENNLDAIDLTDGACYVKFTP